MYMNLLNTFSMYRNLPTKYRTFPGQYGIFSVHTLLTHSSPPKLLYHIMNMYQKSGTFPRYNIPPNEV